MPLIVEYVLCKNLKIGNFNDIVMSHSVEYTEIHSHTFWQKYRESNGFTTFWFLHNFNIHCVDICSNHSLYEMQLRLIVQLEKFFFEINLKVDELFFA